MTKKTLVAAFAAATLTSYSQLLDYNDLGILFSQDERNGTARFNAMGGAFGALGSDISAIDINPAGAAVSKSSKISVSLGNRSTNYDVNYYGNSNSIENQDFDLNQFGAIFVFHGNNNSDWNRFALSVNYKLKNNFDNFYSGSGNSDFLFYDQHINDLSATPTIFDRSLSQSFSHTTSGSNSFFNIGLSGVHDNKLYIGASVKIHDIEYSEIAYLNEVNDDIDGNILDVEDIQERYIAGTGFSFNAGFIYKLNKFMRIGASYESPTWYTETIEENFNTLRMFGIENLGIAGVEDLEIQGPYSLNFRTPSRFTASGALVFGKLGLISFDYTYKDYQNFNYDEPDTVLQEANQFFNTDFRNTHAFNLGTEWRFERVSLRGGAFYEKNPNLVVGGGVNDDNIRGYSAGLGYNFGNTKIDLAYQKTENTQFYSLYELEDITIDNNRSRITATVTFEL